MSRPRVVLFDLGNVLVFLRLERFWDALHEPDAERRLRVGHELREMGNKILGWERETYVYFDNDFQGFAIRNALTLKGMLGV